MKKYLTIIAALALLSSLTACANAENTPSDSRSVSQSSETSSDIGHTEPENSEASASGAESKTDNTPFDLRSGDDGFKEKLALFDMSDFTLPNGEVLKNEDAVLVHGYGDSAHYIGFDSLYLYKAKPYFRNTADEPNMINWDTFEVAGAPENFTDYEFFKVKAGDVLDNGLKVKSAEMRYGKMMMDDIYLDISFDGEITLEGIMYRTPEDEYMSDKGDLRFFPDTAKNSDIVVPYRIYHSDPTLFADNVNKLAVYYSCDPIHFGNESDAEPYISEMFGDGVFAKVKVTLGDLRFVTTSGGVIASAALKYAVKL